MRQLVGLARGLLRVAALDIELTEAERRLQIALDWARYGELLDFDPDSEELVLPSQGQES
jgi:hypothetical protein